MAATAKEYKEFIKNIKGTEWTSLIKSTAIPESILEEKQKDNTRQNWEAIIRYQKHISFDFILRHVDNYTKIAFENIAFYRNADMTSEFIEKYFDKIGVTLAVKSIAFDHILLKKLIGKIESSNSWIGFFLGSFDKDKTDMIKVLEEYDFINQFKDSFKGEIYYLSQWKFSPQYLMDNFQKFKDIFKKCFALRNDYWDDFIKQYSDNPQIQLLNEMAD